MKHQLILELTKLFTLQRKALALGKKSSAARVQRLLAKKATSLKEVLVNKTAGSEDILPGKKFPQQSKDFDKFTEEEVITMQREWEKTKHFLKELKNVCDDFFFEEQETYVSSGERKFTRRSGSKIASA